MGRVRFIVIGAIVGIAWAASLRGFMQQLAGPESTFTFTGTFGIIIPTGAIVGALLGWAEYQHRSGHQYRMLVLVPLLIGIIPDLATATLDPGPIGLALVAMVGGYAISGRGPRWTRIVAGAVNLSGVAVTFLAPKPYPDLSATTPHGAWFATLGSSLGLVLALACSIPMRRSGTDHSSSLGDDPVAAGAARYGVASNGRSAVTGAVELSGLAKSDATMQTAEHEPYVSRAAGRAGLASLGRVTGTAWVLVVSALLAAGRFAVGADR